MFKKKIYQYTVFYETDLAEGGYIANVPSLPGCHTQGETLEEAETNIKEAIEAYLLSLQKRREYIPREEKIYHGVVKVMLPV